MFSSLPCERALTYHWPGTVRPIQVYVWTLAGLRASKCTWLAVLLTISLIFQYLTEVAIYYQILLFGWYLRMLVVPLMSHSRMFPTMSRDWIREKDKWDRNINSGKSRRIQMQEFSLSSELPLTLFSKYHSPNKIPNVNEKASGKYFLNNGIFGWNILNEI